MKFAQFQSTYKPIPTDVYERTGQELEAKYYKNRQDSSLLRQAMANTKVENRNIGILAKATTDVENMLEDVNGKWHYASNILYNAKDRITNDKALNASMEDYAKAQNTKLAVQKQFEEGKIDQDALNAFYTNDKRYNNKAISVDENGQLTNRWNAPTPPPKVDTEKKVLEITTLLTQHKDTLAAGNVKGTPVAEIYNNHPALEGYIRIGTATGVDGNEIANAVKAWINSTPEIKQYYNYINDAKVFDAVTEKNSKGEYLQDENGEFIQRDITAKDFRDLGIQVTDDWVTEKNSMTYAGEDGKLITTTIKGASPDFKETPLYKELLEATGSDKVALQQLYKKTLTDMQTDKIVDFSRQFGFREQHNEIVLNKRYWFDKERQVELDKNKDIYFVTPGTTTPVKIPTYDSNKTQTLLSDLIKERNSIPTDPILQKDSDRLKYKQLDFEIKNLQNREKLLRSSYLKSPEGEIYTDSLFEDFVDHARNKKDKEIIINNKSKVIDYLTGQTEEIGFNLPSYFFKIRQTSTSEKMPVSGDFPSVELGWYPNKEREGGYTVLSQGRLAFNDALTKKIQNDGLEISYETGILTDNNGIPSKAMEGLNKFIQSNASEFKIVNQASRYQDMRETLGQVIDTDLENGNASLYDFNLEVPKGKNNDGKFFLRITPKISGGKEIASKLKQDTYIIEPNANNKSEFMRNLGTIAITNDKTGIGSDWGMQQIANTLYRHYFEDIENTLAMARKQNPNIKFEELGEQYFTNVLMADGNKYNFKLVPTDEYLSLYQLDSYGVPRGTPTNFISLSDVEDSFKNAYFNTK
ncbi:MAG: hypothetical protein M0R17_06905 [Candidatus Omnitrophica bacterium]|jgi:hypothetical protein|nr:hypothetical protein [Candidatus Omnitrophota bacterium]